MTISAKKKRGPIQKEKPCWIHIRAINVPNALLFSLSVLLQKNICIAKIYRGGCTMMMDVQWVMRMDLTLE